MKLTELNPRWFAEPGRSGQGMTFLCPHCQQCRLAVTFANPTDGGATHRLHHFETLASSLEQNHTEEERREIVPPGYLWQRQGEDFATLSLTPSVDASAAGHWHGFITNGEIK